MRTFAEILNDINATTGERFTIREVLRIFDTETSWVGSTQQILKIKSLLLEITGVRPGDCTACNLTTLKSLNQWVKNQEKEPEQKKYKRK